MLTEIVNHLWQSTLMAAVLAALAAALRDHGAHVRFWLWWAASVKFLVPFSLLVALGGALGRPAAAPLGGGAWASTFVVFAEPMSAAVTWTPAAFALVGLWAIGFAGVLVTWIARALKVSALVRASVPFAGALPPLARGPEVRTSPALVEPALVGIARPVLLLPSGIAEHLTQAQLRAILEHELTHWRRRDNLTAAVHMAVEAVFWFHPLVWWIGARLVEERERACDEAVVRAGHDGRAYAEGILNVCEHYVASRLECAAGVSGADLKRRVLEIARNKVMKAVPTSKRVALAVFALATVIAPILIGAVSGQPAQQPAAPSERNLIPLVRINPNYPPSALAAKLEGEVILEFTIAANGTTKDIVVVDSTAPDFEEPAITALQRWRYQPVTDNDVPVEMPGVRTIIRFELADEGSSVTPR